MEEDDLELDDERCPTPYTAPPSSMYITLKPSGSRSCPIDLDRYSSLAAPYGPTDPIASTYFQVVISKSKAPIICGDAGPIKGKAIYAERDLPKATRIWTESPLLAMQHEHNRNLVLCCQFCYLPLVGDAQIQWREIVSRYNVQFATEKKATSAPSTTEKTPVDVNALEKTLQLLRIAPASCGMASPGATCACGEIYCSKLCRMRAFHEYHAILCPRNEPCSAMGEFLDHTRHTNDIFLLAAKVIARVVSRYLVWRDIVKARQPIDMFYKKPWWEVVVVEEMETTTATASHGSDETNSDSGERSNSSSHVDSSPSDVKDIAEEQKTEFTGSDGTAVVPGTTELRPKEGEVPSTTHSTPLLYRSPKAQCLQEVLTLTHQLLIDALECNIVRLEREGQLRGVTVEEIWRCCSSVLSFEFFTAQIGLFEMNNISMEIDHPFHAFLDILDPDVQQEVTSEEGPGTSPRFQPQLTKEDHALIASVRDVLEWEQERLRAIQAQALTTGEPLGPLGYPGIEGTALFPIICTMNHSCDPNCTVLYTKNGDGHVVAIRDIPKGEELCICYIDIDMDVQTREANLREYKFKCFCPRCVSERGEAAGAADAGEQTWYRTRQ